MTFLARIGLAGTAVAAALAISGAAQALQIIQTTGYGVVDSAGSSSDVSSATDFLNATTSRPFSRFDAANGTLDSVRIEIFGIRMNGSASAIFRDDDLFSEVGGLSRLQNMSINYSSIGGFNENRTTFNRTDTCSNGPNFGASSSCTTNLGFNAALTSVDELLTGGLSAFIGAGSFSMTIQLFGSVFHDETDGDDGYVDSRIANLNSGGNIRVTYNYTAPPPPAVAEPASLGVLGLGVLSLAALRRRRQR